MHTRHSFHLVTVLLLAFLLPAASRGAEVLQHLPNDALGFVVIKDLAATDDKVERLLKTVEAKFPGPLAFLKAATGLSEGLDPQGDGLFAVLPGAAAADISMPAFAVWLPIADYDGFITALGGAPGQKIAGVTIAEEDVLVAQHGRWALVMDPADRELMERILSAAPNPPAALAAWNEWIDAQDVAAVALPGGVRAIVVWAAAQRGAQNDPAPAAGDVFGFGQVQNPDDASAAAANNAASAGSVTERVRAAIRTATTTSPRLIHSLLRARLVGCGLRLDENGNLRAGVRVPGAAAQLSLGNRGGEDTQLPSDLYEGGSFVLHGAGTLPPPTTAIVAGGYAQSLINELRTKERMVFPGASTVQFQRAVERASAGVLSAVVLSQPGDKQEGVYTNDFLVVRAASASVFADNAREVMRLWNSMNRDAQAETRLVFDVEEVKFGDRRAAQYSLDIAAADGAPELPEIRQAMEQLFGPGGKLRLWIVPVDDRNVLLAAATPDQIAAALKTLDRKQPVAWDREEISPANRLLPQETQWRLFFSPHHHNQWRRREAHAITGPVIGGPLVKEFPASPPIGIAGGLGNNELWIDAAVPADTLKAAAAYLKK